MHSFADLCKRSPYELDHDCGDNVAVSEETKNKTPTDHHQQVNTPYQLVSRSDSQQNVHLRARVHIPVYTRIQKHAYVLV